jgi:hypothetical protein
MISTLNKEANAPPKRRYSPHEYIISQLKRRSQRILENKYPILEDKGASFIRNVGVSKVDATQRNIPEHQNRQRQRPANLKPRNLTLTFCSS